MKSGSDLISQAVSSQVPSALLSLTSVFGMGTGGSSTPLPPEMVYITDFCQLIFVLHFHNCIYKSDFPELNP